MPGREIAREWLREMLRATEGDYPEFIAALSILFGLAPDEARASSSSGSVGWRRTGRGAGQRCPPSPELPRLFLLEEEYRKALLERRARVAARRDRGPAGRVA